jgi:hypothetical protein
MAKAQVGGVRSVVSASQPTEPAGPPADQALYRFQSRARALRLTLKKRIVRVTLEGERFETPPLSKMETPLDEVKFEENFFSTDDPELAALIMTDPRTNKPRAGYGLNEDGSTREFWLVEDLRKAQEDAQVREVRALLASKPQLLDRVLRPSESDALEMPKPVE